MGALDYWQMRYQIEDETNQEAEAVNPYGDVALGVECAWPQHIPVAQATPSSDASLLQFQM